VVGLRTPQVSSNRLRAACVLALRKTVRFFPWMIVIATIPALVDGFKGWGIADLSLPLIAAVVCLPAVFGLFLFADWLSGR
jgi:hypothetical protein